MYLYFDKTGTLKEIINDDKVREGSANADKVFVYVESELPISDIYILFRKPDGTLTSQTSILLNTVTKEIPYDKHRDMKFFKDYKSYNFYYYTLTSTDLSVAGLMRGTVTLFYGTAEKAFGMFTFNVEDSVVVSDPTITASQYQDLLSQLSGYKAEIQETFGERIENTYTKQEVDEMVDELQESIGNNMDAIADLQDNVYQKNEVDAIHEEIVGMFDDYYNRDEVDEKIQDVENAVNDRVSQVEELIPDTASSENQLADRNFVNSSINSMAAFPIEKDAQGNSFESVSELLNASVYYSGGVVRVPTRNDYAIVRVDQYHDNATTHYYYNEGWRFGYVVNETPLTSDQLASLNSGITASLVSKLQNIDMDEKLDKVETTGNKRVYGIDTDGTQTEYTVEEGSATANTIVMRNASGQVYGENPTQAKHLTNKEYVDGKMPILTQLSDGSYSLSI